MATNHIWALYEVYFIKNRFKFLRHCTVPVKFRYGTTYLLEFHSAHMAIFRVIEGKMTSAWHYRTRMAPSLHLRTGTGQFWFAPLGTGRCSSRHRPMFYNVFVELPPVESDMFLQKYILHLDILLL